MLGVMTAKTGTPYDLSQMYVGTVHSLGQRLIVNRRFYPARKRHRPPVLTDELGQYFYLYRRRQWEHLTQGIEWDDDPKIAINRFFTDGASSSQSRHAAVTNVIALFNRLSEECLQPENVVERVDDPTYRSLLAMYANYVASLRPHHGPHRTDFALLKQNALDLLLSAPLSGSVFKHVIIDEYQDTNTIQERLFFKLASGHKNLCIVGDDDQALYRFRGATVENFVDFPERCRNYLRVAPHTISLDVNYRSRKRIVDFYVASSRTATGKIEGSEQSPTGS